MNILVTGANGQLGNEMRIVARESQDRYIFSDIIDLPGLRTVKLDITDSESVMSFIKENEIRCIANCAAYTNVDKSEEDQETCELLNAIAPKNLAVAMKEVGGILIHISTDYVFGGDLYNTPCKENLKGTPTGVYGLTKLQGEQAIQEIGCKYIIIRMAWLYSEFGKNFVKTMMNLTATKPSLKVVFDQVGTPTYALDLAKVIFDIVENRKHEGNEGIYHFSNEGVCSWYDFAKVIAEYSGHTGCDIQPCHSSEYPSPVKRPAFSVLDNTKIKQSFGVVIPYWMDSLKLCVANMSLE